MAWKKPFHGQYANRGNAVTGTAEFYPKRIVRSFRDLEVYQKTFQCSVDVMKKIVPLMKEDALRNKIIESSLSIPSFIAEAHSRRFDEPESANKLMEESMAECNKLIVYLEQARDIHNADKIITEEIIKSYLNSRQKILNLERVWKKFQSNEGAKLK